MTDVTTDTTMVEDKAHARLSASGAARWMACPASVNFEAQFPDSSSVFAREGTAAHHMAEECLLNMQEPEDWRGKEIEVEGDVFVVGQEMIDAVQTYVNHVEQTVDGNVFYEVERRVD